MQEVEMEEEVEVVVVLQHRHVVSLVATMEVASTMRGLVMETMIVETILMRVCVVSYSILHISV